MQKGLLEYLLVTPKGSTHREPARLRNPTERLAPRDAPPRCARRGDHHARPKDAAPPQINREYLATAPKLKGDPITITVKWKTADGDQDSSG
jgi:hypothetical protein